jgi:hypothetical protein
MQLLCASGAGTKMPKFCFLFSKGKRFLAFGRRPGRRAYPTSLVQLDYHRIATQTQH